MKTTQLSKDGLNQKFSVVISAADIERQMEQELASLGHKVKMPGFRPGKVPMHVLKQRYAKDVMGEVVNNSVNKAARDLIEKEKLRPALQPDVKIVEFPEGGDMTLEIEVEMLPEITEPDFAKITIEELVCDVTDAEVEDGLKRLAENSKHTHKAPADAEAKLGDVVKMDFVGKLGGEPFEGGAGNGFQLELGSGQFIPGFEEQVVGMTAGMKRTIQVTFPKDYHAKNLAGQKADFDITCHEVLHMHTPQVDAHLAEVVGFESLEKLREAVKSRIADEYQQVSRAKAKKALFDELDEMLNFEVPKRMQAMEFDSIWKQIEQAKKQGDESLKGKSEDELKKEYEGIAKRRVKLGILLSEVGRKHNVHVTKEELSAAVMQQARQYPGQEDKVFEFYRRNPQQVDELRGPILEEKAVDFILAKVTREQRKVTAEALMAEDDAEDTKAKKKKK